MTKIMGWGAEINKSKYLVPAFSIMLGNFFGNILSSI